MVLDWIQIVGPPLLMLVGGIITWIIKSKIEELHAIEEKLREDRRKIYIQILDPYIRLFSGLKNQNREKIRKEVTRKIISYEYRKIAFELNLFGSDEVVRAYNELMQHTYKAESIGERDPKKIMHLWGNFLLEIRKSLGNKKTTLDEIDMLRGMITDIDQYL